jgi:hypothetical protein
VSLAEYSAHTEQNDSTQFDLTVCLALKIHYFSLMSADCSVRSFPCATRFFKLITCLIVPYGIMFTLAFLHRIRYINGQRTCIIGVGRQAMTPILAIDVVVNIWLTYWFVQPSLAIPKQTSSRANLVLRKVAERTLIGFVLALLACLGNIISLYITQGMKGWICLLVCNTESE